MTLGPGLEAATGLQGRKGDRNEGAEPLSLSSLNPLAPLVPWVLWQWGGGLCGPFWDAGGLSNLGSIPHSKSGGAPKAEEMVAMGSGEWEASSSVGRAGETQLYGGSPPARPGEPYLSGHCHRHRHSPQH